MKLRYSPTSPYVRKVMVCAIETGLVDRIELLVTQTADPALRDQNPLGKVPTLVTDDGQFLFDSPVICEYLDSLHQGHKLFPAAGPARWSALRMQALADGILDASLSRRQEAARPPERQHEPWVAHQRRAVATALDALERQSVVFAREPDIGLVTAGCALGYLDLRFAADDWRSNTPRLAAWYEQWAARPSMQRTVPVDPR